MIIGQTYKIQWDITNFSKNESVEIVLMDKTIPTASLSKAWQETIPNTGNYDLTVPEVLPGDKYVVYISNSEAYGYSEMFSIATSQNLSIKGWKIYRNEEYGFEFDYPDDWNINDTDYNLGANLAKDITKQEGDLTYMFEFFIFNKPSDQVWYKIDRLDHIEYITLDNKISAVKGQEKYEGFPALVSIWTYNSKGYLFRSIPRMDEPRFKEIFDKMLSTFKFIEKDANGWIIIRDEKEGYEFKYPSDFNFFKSPEVLISGIDPAGFSNKICRDEVTKDNIIIKKLVVGENIFCSYIVEDGAAGSAYTDYKYSIIKDDKDFTLHFSIKYTDCEIIDNNTDQKKCEDFNKKIAPETINQILYTFKFLN